MSRIALTTLAVKNAKGPAEIFDTLCPGLCLRVRESGKKTWSFMYTSPRGAKQRARMSIGTFPATELKQARDAALEARGQLERGIDPQDARAASAAAKKTISELMTERFKIEMAGKLRSADEVLRRFGTNVAPVVGHVMVRDFRILHLNMVIDPIVERGAPIQANRTFADLRALLNFAVRRGEIDFSPLNRAKMPSKSVIRERFLTPAEITAVWRELPNAMPLSKHVPAILRLCLATGQRLSEVAGLSRGEINLGARLWTLPAARSKNKFEHQIPLNDLAVEIIQGAMDETNSAYLFPDATGEGPTLHHVIDRCLARAHKLGKFTVPVFRPHDLRRTVATNMSVFENGLHVPDHIISHILNHRSAARSSITQIVYNRNGYLPEKREALDKWGAFLAKLVGAEQMQVAA